MSFDKDKLRILTKLGAVWEKYPVLSLGQMLAALCGKGTPHISQVYKDGKLESLDVGHFPADLSKFTDEKLECELDNYFK